MKKFAFLLMLLLALGMSAAVAEVSGDFEYTVRKGTAMITDYNGSATDLTIPEELDGLKVTEIGTYAFEECTTLISVIIPNSVTTIDSGAFSDCSSLTNISFPDSLTSIGQYAFTRCTSLRSVNIPDSVTYLG